MQQLHNLNLEDDFMANLREKLYEPDMILGKGLNMPNNPTCSGSRKILFGTQREHVIPVNDAEVPYIQTGYEQQFGEYSSSIIRAEEDCQVIAKIDKYPGIPNYNYYLILLNNRTGMLDVLQRVSYKHITESYGYMINNDIMDSLKIGDVISKGTVIQKSACYDQYNNRKDGINALTAYISMGQTEEDGIVISRSFANRIVTPLVHRVSIVANDNDIPLNIYGDTSGSNYKILPDIGEAIPNGILAATRRENKEESLYTQTYIRLKDILMSDDKYTTNGTVVDVNVYANNPEMLQTNPYYSQINKYYRNDMTFCQNLVNVIDGLGGIYPLSYSLNELYTTCKKKLDGVQHIKDKPFSNVIIDLVVIEQKPIEVGDKLSDRYGGKGVVVKIYEDYMMPMLPNGKIVDIIFNKSTCVNRLNPGQEFETSYNHIAQHLLDYMRVMKLEPDECMELIYRFFDITNPSLSQYTRQYYESLKEDDKRLYVETLKSMDGIHQSYRPISDSADIDILDRLYKEFPWIKQYDVYVSVQDSNGRWRRIKARRPIVCGTKYIYRLKQYAEEKFSTTSLSPTNIKNENSKSRANKLYREPCTKTPIKFGEMESGNYGHMGMTNVIVMLIMYSSSPHGRRLSGETLLTGDPFNIDVKLDKYSCNSEVQILNTSLKTIGLRLRFKKVPRVLKRPIIKQCFIKLDEQPKVPLWKPFYKVENPTPRDFELARLDVERDHNHNGSGLMSPFIRMGFYHDNYKKIFGD